MPNPNKGITNPKRTGQWLTMVLTDHKTLEHELAKILDVSEQRVINWAKGERGMRLYMVMAICYIFELDEDPKKIYQFLKEP